MSNKSFINDGIYNYEITSFPEQPIIYKLEKEIRCGDIMKKIPNDMIVDKINEIIDYINWKEKDGYNV